MEGKVDPGCGRRYEDAEDPVYRLKGKELEETRQSIEVWKQWKSLKALKLEDEEEGNRSGATTQLEKDTSGEGNQGKDN
ncbi:hypothetical protein Ddye_004910 [Dipteronia dyeriana]|uniref:Uncharacterized protein n=1 Tax=Dipteronia dyeriana TaxID=168575 RepID=A0AAE0CP75_9ROSI|nr:hypothetical protein Ddye_004910 [Dipteronia dyeriana]